MLPSLLLVFDNRLFLFAKVVGDCALFDESYPFANVSTSLSYEKMIAFLCLLMCREYFLTIDELPDGVPRLFSI